MKPSPRTAALKELSHRLRSDQVVDQSETIDILKEALEIHTNQELVDTIVTMSEDLDRLKWMPYHLTEAMTHLKKIENLIPEEAR